MLVCVKHIVVHKRFWHKFYFIIFFWIFKKLFIICAEISIIIIKLNSEVVFTVQFEPQNMPNPWTYGSNSLDTLRLSHKDNNVIFISLYKHYVSKFSELKNQLPKLRFEILLIIQQFVAKSIHILRIHWALVAFLQNWNFFGE
jgi:hypothetical protein